MTPLILGWIGAVLLSLTPGPSILGTVGISMARGRQAAMRFALGVVIGSTVWAGLGALGLAALLETYGSVASVLKIAGAGYLAFLAFKAIRRASAPVPAPPIPRRSEKPLVSAILLQATNAKAIFGWTAVAAVALPGEAGGAAVLLFLLGALPLNYLVTFGYAFVFSTPKAMAFYQRLYRPLEVVLASFFSAAAVGLVAEAARR